MASLDVAAGNTLSMGVEDEDRVSFDSPQEEAAHYREKYRRILDMLDETRAELDEFQASSKELEDELERELSATEEKQAELKDRIQRLERDKQEWMGKHVALQKMHSSTTAAMQREMDNLRSERDKTLVALRDLEMGNDELERNERVALSSLLDLESKYNRAIEEKTLLEQEIIQKQQLEEECQRLKDDVRDANNEIAILKDQLSRSTIPSPPSSVSVSSSSGSSGKPRPRPAEDKEVVAPNPKKATDTPDVLRQSARLPRSTTVSSIPTLSPAAKRHSTRTIDSPVPNGVSNLARSTTTRNLAQNVGSPALNRTRVVTAPGSSNATRAENPNLAAKTKGFKLLHDLQARLKATDDKLGTRVPKRLVSGPLPFGHGKRTASSASAATTNSHVPVASRRAAGRMSMAPMSTPPDANQTSAAFLSPNGWEMIGTPGDNRPAKYPDSPLEAVLRPASSTNGRSLPSRPGIPSPLASSLSRSTGGKAAHPPPSSAARPPSRGPTPSHYVRPASRTMDSRPLSPSMLRRPLSAMRSPTPTLGQTMSAVTSSASTSRPSSRAGQGPIGRGPPPSYMGHELQSPGLPHTPSALRRSARRSSLGPAEAALPPTSIPGPARTPGRPVSLHVHGDTPPPVPRIPSAHLRQASRDKLAASVRGRVE